MSTKKRHLKDQPKYEDWLNTELKNKGEASLYLQAAFNDYHEDGDIGCFLLAIRDVVKAQSSMTELSRKTGLNRESLYCALSENGNPQFSTIWSILFALGFYLEIKPLKNAA